MGVWIMDMLKQKWEQYGRGTSFNYSKIEKKLHGNYPIIQFDVNTPIVLRGESPQYIYFILSGVAIGTRDYEDGNEYDYFHLDKSNGSVGLLETLAQKEAIIATVSCLSKVEAIRIPSAIVYELIMQDLELLRLSLHLLADDLYDRSGNDGLFYHLEGIDRLRYFLITYYDEHITTEGSLIEVEERREKIANKLGMSVRTVGRALKKLKENQEILNKSRKIVIGQKEQQRLRENISYM